MATTGDRTVRVLTGRAGALYTSASGVQALGVAYAVQQVTIWIELSVADPHTQFAHWMLMAATGLLAALGVALGAAQLRGARLPLWMGALTASYLAAASTPPPTEFPTGPVVAGG